MGWLIMRLLEAFKKAADTLEVPE